MWRYPGVWNCFETDIARETNSEFESEEIDLSVLLETIDVVLRKLFHNVEQ